MPAIADLGARALAFVEGLGTVADLGQLSTALLAAIEPLGLAAAACGVVSGPMLAAGRRFFFVDWPGDWLEVYQAENFVTVDPVPRWVRATGRATTFRHIQDVTPSRDPGRRVIEAGATYHLSEGLLVPLPLKDGSVGIVSVGGDRDALSAPERAFLEVVAAATMRRAVELQGPASPRAGGPVLTRRELDCLALVVRGLSDRAIAAKLGIAEPTVRFHLDRARQKTGARSRAHLAALALWLGLAGL